MHIVIVNSKGGCGKTMVATQIASYFAQGGNRVTIFDHDNQRSSIDWVKARPGQCPKIHTVAAYAGESMEQPSDIVIHDMPAGYDIRDLARDVPRVDKMLIPLLPSPTDLRAAWRFCMLLSYTGMLNSRRDVGFIVNRYRANAAYNTRVEEFLLRLDVPVLGAIRDTQNYVHAGHRGLGIFDLPRYRSRADRESWHSVLVWLDSARRTFAEQLMQDLSQNACQPA